MWALGSALRSVLPTSRAAGPAPKIRMRVRALGGTGAAIYRPAGRISTPSALLSMVELCNTELNLGLFPEDVVAVAAVLQRDHYRFAAVPAVRR